MTRPIYESRQVARLLKVSPNQVRKWMDAGILRGWKSSDATERWIPAEDIERFLAHNGFPPLTPEDFSAIESGQ